MIIKFNPTGTHIRKGFLKVRVDLYPEPMDKTYVLHYVDHYDQEPTQEELDNPALLALVPTHKEVNPCLCHFITIPETASLLDITAYLQKLFDKDTVASLDDYLTRPNASHYVSPFMRDKPSLDGRKVKAIDHQALISSVNLRLTGLQGKVEGGGIVYDIQPQTIDVGSEAINRASNFQFYQYTIIEIANPANAVGVMDTVNIWLQAATVGNTDFVGTFSASGAVFTCRDSENMGYIVAGSLQTITGLTVDIQTDDYIGLNNKNTGVARVETATSGGAGVRYVSGEYIDPGDSATFSYSAGYILSLNGTGTEAGGTTHHIAGVVVGATSITGNLKYGASALTEAELEYYEVLVSGDIVARTDVTNRNTQERSDLATILQTDYPTGTIRLHTHHHGNSAPCTVSDV